MFLLRRSVCACSATTCGLSDGHRVFVCLFWFTYSVCPSEVPMCLTCVLCSNMCKAVSFFVYSSFRYSLFAGHCLWFLINCLSQDCDREPRIIRVNRFVCNYEARLRACHLLSPANCQWATCAKNPWKSQGFLHMTRPSARCMCSLSHAWWVVY